jgi:excisionase family DNA binding protein
LLNCGRTRLYELLAAGELDSYIDGRARKIIVASIHRHIERGLAASKDSLKRTDMR